MESPNSNGREYGANTARIGLPHAGRVGPARGDVAGVAAQSRGLAGKFQSIPWLYAEIVRLIAERERVQLIVENAAMERRVTGMLRRAGVKLDRVTFHCWPTDRGWLRDSGPIFVRNPAGEVGITNWRFNGWAKYDDWHLDDELPGRIAEVLRMRQWQPRHDFSHSESERLVLEGGSIDGNGTGALLTTEECLLSEVQQRNPRISREELERALHLFLGVDQVIWLGRGIAGDDTHGHVDDIARFVAHDTIIAAVERDTRDPNHEPLAENLRTLKAARTLEGKQFTVIELPMPRLHQCFAISACRPAMQISTLPTASYWFPLSTIPTTASRSTRSLKLFRIAR